MMNYPFPASPYIHAAMSQAVQAMRTGGALPGNCMIMPIPIQQGQSMLPQLMINHPMGGGGADPMMYSQQKPYYGPSSYKTNPATRVLPPQQNYNYPIVPYAQSKKKPSQPHSNIYNSASFDSYMRHLSWSRLFDRPSRKHSQAQNGDQATGTPPRKARTDSSSSSSSSSSTTSDETIRRVNVKTKPSSDINGKQQINGTLPFKYSSEFLPGLGKQQTQKHKSTDVFLIKKQ